MGKIYVWTIHTEGQVNKSDALLMKATNKAKRGAGSCSQKRRLQFREENYFLGAWDKDKKMLIIIIMLMIVLNIY